MRNIFFTVIGALVISGSFFFVAHAQTSCLLYPSNSVPPSGYGTSWDVFDSGKKLLIRADCELNSAGRLDVSVGGDTAQLAYKTMYSYKGAALGWKAIPLKGTAFSTDWFQGATRPDGFSEGLEVVGVPSLATPQYFVGYVCTNTGSAWKCGCKDASCTTRHWQLQAYIGTGGGNTGGSGGSTGGSGVAPGFPEIRECGSTQTVSGGSLSSLASADGCRILVAAPGSYSAITINGHSGGVVTVKCQSPGACTMGSSSKIENSDGVIFDGFKITGGSEGMRIDGSKNVLVKNSTFTKQGNSGVLVYPGSAQENIQIYDNTFKNDDTGCHIYNPDLCGHLDDGTPISFMDYGVRAYEAKSMAVRGNTFGSIFNHAISLKNGVQYALIEDNDFNGCGRQCIQLGQELSGDECIEGVVRGNRFSGSAINGVMVQRIRKATIADNIFDITGRAIFLDTEIKPAGARQVIQSGNTIR